jgi:hypothetical protein
MSGTSAMAPSTTLGEAVEEDCRRTPRSTSKIKSEGEEVKSSSVRPPVKITRDRLE